METYLEKFKRISSKYSVKSIDFLDAYGNPTLINERVTHTVIEFTDGSIFKLTNNEYEQIKELHLRIGLDMMN